MDDVPEFDPELEFELIELPEPEENQWEEGSSPYDDDTEQDPDVALMNAAGARALTLLASRIGAAAIAWGRGWTSWRPGTCLVFVRSCYGVGSYYGSAALAWSNAQVKHGTSNPYNIPRGAPVFWLGGSKGYGHIAVSLGDGLCLSTDWPYSGHVGVARIADISSSWNQRLVGWTEDVNNVRVYRKPPPTLDVSQVARAVRRGERVTYGTLLKRAIAKEVGKGDMQLTHSVLGGGVKKQYRLVQRKYLTAKGETPNAKTADGIPGAGSLAWLGRRHGFRVKA